jgi:hypothetical protein
MNIMQSTAGNRARFMGGSWTLVALVSVSAVLAAYLTAAGLLRLLPADMWWQ